MRFIGGQNEREFLPKTRLENLDPTSPDKDSQISDNNYTFVLGTNWHVNSIFQQDVFCRKMLNLWR